MTAVATSGVLINVLKILRNITF